MATKKAPVKKENSFEFLQGLKTGNEFADDSTEEIVIRDYIDSGSNAFNAILSGDMTKGFPINKIFMAAGEKQVGKSFLAQYSFGKPLCVDKGYYLYYLDTEGSIDEDELANFGIKKDQSKIIPEDIVEKLTITLNNILNQIEAKKKDKKFKGNLKCAFVLDSQGQLDTIKSRDDTTKGEIKTDLTLQKSLKKMYKTITKRMAMLDIPFFVTAHVYVDNMSASFIKRTIVSGGQGGHHAASIIAHFRKRQYKEGTIRKGTILIGKIVKSRFCIEDIEANIYLDYKKGLNRWYGLHLFAMEAKLLVKMEKSEAAVKRYKKKNITVPEDLTDKTGPKYVIIQDPKLEPKDWIVCKENEVHKKSVIGTVFNELNDWVKDNFKLKRPIDFTYDDDAEITNIEEAEGVDESTKKPENVKKAPTSK